MRLRKLHHHGRHRLLDGASAATTALGRPSIFVAYRAIWSQMIALGEMTTLYPVNGAFVHYASRFIDPSVGFALGWVSGLPLPRYRTEHKQGTNSLALAELLVGLTYPGRRDLSIRTLTPRLPFAGTRGPSRSRPKSLPPLSSSTTGPAQPRSTSQSGSLFGSSSSAASTSWACGTLVKPSSGGSPVLVRCCALLAR